MFVFFFFSSRRRHTRLQGDWSSDVCSSDLWRWRSSTSWRCWASGTRRRGGPVPPAVRDRERGVEGKRVDLGGRRIIKKKKKKHKGDVTIFKNNRNETLLDYFIVSTGVSRAA